METNITPWILFFIAVAIAVAVWRKTGKGFS